MGEWIKKNTPVGDSIYTEDEEAESVAIAKRAKEEAKAVVAWRAWWGGESVTLTARCDHFVTTEDILYVARCLAPVC